jgi:excisionase family DNA binding protein
MPMEPLISVQEFARVLAIDPSTLRRMVKQKKVAAIRVGGVWRFRPAVLRELIGEKPRESRKP